MKNKGIKIGNIAYRYLFFRKGVGLHFEIQQIKFDKLCKKRYNINKLGSTHKTVGGLCMENVTTMTLEELKRFGEETTEAESSQKEEETGAEVSEG